MDDSNKTVDQQHKNIDVEQVQQQIVPVLKQDYSISKETSIKEAKIENANEPRKAEAAKTAKT